MQQVTQAQFIKGGACEQMVKMIKIYKVQVWKGALKPLIGHDNNKSTSAQPDYQTTKKKPIV